MTDGPLLTTHDLINACAELFRAHDLPGTVYLLENAKKCIPDVPIAVPEDDEREPDGVPEDVMRWAYKAQAGMSVVANWMLGQKAERCTFEQVMEVAKTDMPRARAMFNASAKIRVLPFAAPVADQGERK